MKKFKLISTLIYFSIVLFSCEQISVIESEIPFNEMNVVNGRLIGDSSNVSISFTKSFPIEKEIRHDDVAITNVIAYIWCENQGIFPLQHTGNGYYKPKDVLRILPGESYELYAKIQDERIYAKTYVPRYPIVKDVKILVDFVNCKILPNSNTVYGVKYKLVPLDLSDEIFEETIFYEISNKIEDTSQAVEVKTSKLPDKYLEETDKYNLSLTVYSFDENYKAYFATRENNKPIENIFSEGGGSVYWNVEGQNSLGLFIGYTKLILSDIKL